MKQPSPMTYFTPFFKAARARVERQRACVSAQGPLVEELYDQLLLDLRLGPHIIKCDARKAPKRGQIPPDELARRLSQWAVMRVLFQKNLPHERIAELQAIPVTLRMQTLLDAIYNTMLLIRTFEPESCEDRIIRAILDNRPGLFGTKGDVTLIEQDVSLFYRKGDPEKPAMLHEAIFLNGAVIHFYEHKGGLVYQNHRSAPPSHILNVAMQRLLAAMRFAVDIRWNAKAQNLDLEDTEELLIKAIRALHAQGPLTLASPQSISELNVRQILCGKEVCDG